MSVENRIKRISASVGLGAALAFPATTPAQQVQPADATPGPQISVDIRNETRPTERTMSFVATPGSYVTVVRVNTAGRLEVLYPASPDVQRSLVASDERVAIPNNKSAFNPHAEGSIYAFASMLPYDFSKVADKKGSRIIPAPPTSQSRRHTRATFQLPVTCR